MKFNIQYIITIVSLFLWGCEDVYVPELETTENALVVECQLTDREEFVNIKLSRTVPFEDRSYFFGERQAQVYLKSVGGEQYEAKEVSKGNYQTSVQVKPKIGEGYYLYIRTKDSLEYQSDVEIMMPPSDVEDIHLTDTISRQINTDYWGNPYVTDFEGIMISVLPTVPEDPNVGFLYKWNALINYYILCDVPPKSYSFYCWKNVNSSLIYIYDYNERETNNQLILDDLHFLSYYGISPQPIDSSRFSILNPMTKKPELLPISSAYSTSFYYRLRQYTITKKGADFWKGVKRQSEATGKLFDPVEEQLITNIHCITDEAVPAFGFFNTASFSERIIRVHLKPHNFTDIYEIDVMPVSDSDEDCGIVGEKPDFWY